jgi:hypothetical protein
MITIFCDFRQYSAKQLAFFLKPMLWSFFHNLHCFVLSQKRHFSANLFGENIFKNHSIGSWQTIKLCWKNWRLTRTSTASSRTWSCTRCRRSRRRGRRGPASSRRWGTFRWPLTRWGKRPDAKTQFLACRSKASCIKTHVHVWQVKTDPAESSNT